MMPGATRIPVCKTPLKHSNRLPSNSVTVGAVASLKRRSRDFSGLSRPNTPINSKLPALRCPTTQKRTLSPPSKIARTQITVPSAAKPVVASNSKEIEEKLQQLEYRYQECVDSNKNLESELKSRDEKINELEGEKENALNEVTHLQNVMKTHEESAKIQDMKLKGADSKITILKEQLDLKNEIIESKNMQLESRQVQLEKEKINNENLKEANSCLEDKNGSLKKELDDKINEISNLQQQLTNLKNELRLNDLQSRKLLNDVVDLRGQIRIAVRVRPCISGESNLSALQYPNPCSIRLENGGKSTTFKYQKVYPPTINQRIVFEDVEELIQSCLHGYNVAIIAYGQTGSGKTYTMIGGPNEQEGLIPRAAKNIFQNKSKLFELGWTFDISVSFLEIYVEEVYDLLNNRQKIDLKMGSGSCIATDLHRIPINNEDDISNVLVTASKYRSVAATKCNEQSSRSHAVFQMHIEAKNEVLNSKLESTLSLVDLAGSERAKESGSADDKNRFKEMTAINLGLSNLQKCIRAQLTKSQHISYRDSKLTMLLMSSLGGGNSKTMVIVGLNPSSTQEFETKRSLDFAQQMSMTTIGAAVKQQK